MSGPIVLTPAQSATPPLPPSPSSDPLSEVLALLKPERILAGGFTIPEELSISFPPHQGIKCYAMLSGQGWLEVEGVPAPMHLVQGDCFLLPRGLPFRLTTDLALASIDFHQAWSRLTFLSDTAELTPETRCLVGGFFSLADHHATMLLGALPPVIHIRGEREKATMRWSLERMREELRDPQPGGTLVAQQLAYMMLVQALRLHLASPAAAGVGWLPALANPHMSAAIAAMHREPGRRWTLGELAATVGMSRSVFALRFREIVGLAPMQYLARWRMLVAAEQLRHANQGISAVAASLGYDSESSFGKAFRRVMGSSPRQYVHPA